MKVAIIGAGPAGLSCAYELEKHDIVPTIFEEKRYVGENVDFSTCTLKLFDRGIANPLKRLDRKYNIKLTPFRLLKEIIMISPNSQSTVQGNLGLIFNRGEHADSLENQLASMVRSPITLENKIELNSIRNAFDYIVVATGNTDIATQLNVCNPLSCVLARLAVVKGNFKTDSLRMWVNTNYARNCFAFLLASTPEKACLVLAVNDITFPELDYYWNEFLSVEKINYNILNTSDVKNTLGVACPPRFNNIFFVGKAAGYIDGILGFGMIDAIESGILAARSIVKGSDYIDSSKPISKDIEKKYEFRKVLNTFSNNYYDILIGLLGFPVVKQLIYNNPFAKVTHLTPLARLYNMYR